jgi:GDPmannose 4,6-dehydratase
MNDSPSSPRKKALITGVTGQDGSYLAELLLEKGYDVHGVVRRVSVMNRQRIDALYPGPQASGSHFQLYYGDVADSNVLISLVAKLQPDEIYNLAAQSHVRVSFDIPEYTANVTALGTLRMLEAIRLESPKSKFYQASSSEMFGAAPPRQSESTPFEPQSPYGAAKVFAHHVGKNYREGYGLWVSSGILFNHESPRRGVAFVSRKITRSVARIANGLQDYLYLGTLDAKRDWGYAPEYVEAMWMMMQHEEPDDFVIATGEAHTVREFLEEAFAHVNLDWRKYVRQDERYLRPSDVWHLEGDASKAEGTFGWKPETTFKELVRIMMEADLLAARKEKAARETA